MAKSQDWDHSPCSGCPGCAPSCVPEPGGAGLRVRTDCSQNWPWSSAPSTEVPQGAGGVLGARAEVPHILPDASKAFALKVEVGRGGWGADRSAL